MDAATGCRSVREIHRLARQKRNTHATKYTKPKAPTVLATRFRLRRCSGVIALMLANNYSTNHWFVYSTIPIQAASRLRGEICVLRELSTNLQKSGPGRKGRAWLRQRPLCGGLWRELATGIDRRSGWRADLLARLARRLPAEAKVGSRGHAPRAGLGAAEVPGVILRPSPWPSPPMGGRGKRGKARVNPPPATSR